MKSGNCPHEKGWHKCKIWNDRGFECPFKELEEEEEGDYQPLGRPIAPRPKRSQAKSAVMQELVNAAKPAALEPVFAQQMAQARPLYSDPQMQDAISPHRVAKQTKMSKYSYVNANALFDSNIGQRMDAMIKTGVPEYSAGRRALVSLITGMGVGGAGYAMMQALYRGTQDPLMKSLLALGKMRYMQGETPKEVGKKTMDAVMRSSARKEPPKGAAPAPRGAKGGAFQTKEKYGFDSRLIRKKRQVMRKYKRWKRYGRTAVTGGYDFKA